MKTKLSVQAQFLHDPTLDLARLRRLNPKWVKYFQPDQNRTKELLDMGFHVCLRFHSISEQHFELTANPRLLGQQHGQFWITKLRHEWGLSDEQISRVAVEGINEPSVANEEEAMRVDTYGTSFAESSAQGSVFVATPNLSTGWPYNHGHGLLPDYNPFRVLVDMLRRTGSYWASHEYCDRRGPDSDDWRWNMGRILTRPAWFKQSGVKILITECGYDQAVNAPKGTPHHSWNGHISAANYAANYLGVYDYRMRIDPDVEALFVFLLDTNDPNSWWTFNVDACWDEIVAHADWMANQPEPDWPVVPDPLPPPTPSYSPEFNRALEEFTSPWEGEYSDNPADKGNWTGGKVGVGILKGTKYGISAASYPHLDIKNLTRADAKDIYWRDYWLKTGADKLKWPLSMIQFDTAVNMGTGAASKLQHESNGDYILYMLDRMDDYLDFDGWAVFGNGWIRRSIALLRKAYMSR